MVTESPPVSLSSGDREELTRLILAAFGMARAAGKADWQTMTVAVLKNRLIDITGGSFDEKKYGVPRFAELLRALPELLSVDWAVRPALAVLLVESGESLEVRHEPGRVRDDLWRAVYDFSQGGAYVWSNSVAVWVPHANSDDLVLPTMSAEEFGELRTSFALKSGVAEAVEWADTRQGTSGLPAELRRSWNKALTENAWLRLRPWFEDRGIPVPSTDAAPSPSPHSGPIEDTERLRWFVQRCVSVMTLEELSSLLIPARVAARVRR